MTAFENQTPLTLTFCDVSKAFDHVWIRGLIYKLEKYGVRGNIKFMYIIMSTDMVKNIFKDNPLKNFTNATKE
jgi:hypothetical protein